jgi:hypothetical protein
MIKKVKESIKTGVKATRNGIASVVDGGANGLGTFASLIRGTKKINFNISLSDVKETVNQ